VVAGDINNDGAVDLILGAQSADPGGRTEAGETYVVFGEAVSSPAIGPRGWALIATAGFIAIAGLIVAVLLRWQRLGN
jgi:hypothetical protein